MLVSNLLVARWGSSNPPTVRQDYLLQITNLHNQSIRFVIECQITDHHLYVGAVPPRSLKELLDEAVWGMAGRWFETPGGFYGFIYRDIPANGAATWSLYSRDFKPSNSVSTSVAGYVSLRVPVIRSDKDPYDLVPQSDEPVQVLLSAWTERAVEGPNMPTVSYRSEVQLASGKGHNEIIPDTSLDLKTGWFSRYTTTLTTGTQLAHGALDLREAEAAQALIDLLSQFGNDEVETAALNRALRDRRAPISVRSHPRDE